MAPTKTIGALLALLVVATGAAAAMPGNAPVDAAGQADNQPADAQDAQDARTDEKADDEKRQAGGPPEQAAGERGPPVDMPDPVPDFVSDIHQTIQDHLNGAVDDLGAAVSDITPGDDSESDDADAGVETNETGNESVSGTDQPTATPA